MFSLWRIFKLVSSYQGCNAIYTCTHRASRAHTHIHTRHQYSSCQYARTCHTRTHTCTHTQSIMMYILNVLHIHLNNNAHKHTHTLVSTHTHERASFVVLVCVSVCCSVWGVVCCWHVLSMCTFPLVGTIPDSLSLLKELSLLALDHNKLSMWDVRCEICAVCCVRVCVIRVCVGWKAFRGWSGSLGLLVLLSFF